MLNCHFAYYYSLIDYQINRKDCPENIQLWVFVALLGLLRNSVLKQNRGACGKTSRSAKL